MKKRNILYFLLVLAFLSCKEANPIVELPPIVEEEKVSIDTYCVVEEEPILSDDLFYVHDTGEQEHGFATAIKLDKEWSASAFAKIIDGEASIAIKSYNGKETSFYHQRELFSFRLSQIEKGCFIGTKDIEEEWTGKHAKIIYHTVSGDVGEDSYELHLEDSLGNYVEIDSINLEANFISGYFMLGFNNTDSNPKEWNPPYVRFLNGRFECAIIE